MKHPFSVRLAAVTEYLSGKSTLAETALQFNVGQTPLRRWVRALKHQGEEGLVPRRPRIYPPEFRLSVVRYVLDNRCSSADAAAHFGIPNETVIQNWLRKYRAGGSVALTPSRTGPAMMKKSAPDDKPLTEMTHKELLKELEYLRAENAVLKKFESPERRKGARGSAEKTKIVCSLLPEHRLASLLRAIGLPRSSYYYHVSKDATETDRYAAVIPVMTALHRKHSARYGYRRMTIMLRREGFTLNHKTVRKLMKQHGLTCQIRRRKYRSWMNDGNKSSANLLSRHFEAERSGMKWCTDVTEFRAGGETLYLSVVQDLFNREIVAWEMSTRPALSLTCKMLEKALKTGLQKEGIMLHSDQGWQYRTPMWRSMLAEGQVLQSMSRKGNCLDNAVMENFFSHLKVEMYHRKKYESGNALKRDIDRYIRYYNCERINLRMGMSPAEYRAMKENQ
ncbi:IS3 family transposase [Pantoea sp. BIGb0393]|uniref:IS3 family transposase n=1 Tax=Pantoea nemavictus TaxID=2726955 RepID=A0ABU8PM53_9GAMM|nr:IS3 family transposase [Pantoea nemavictus]MBA0034627.1 IS3 family transposase [Pantoea nemavictus]